MDAAEKLAAFTIPVFNLLRHHEIYMNKTRALTVKMLSGINLVVCAYRMLFKPYDVLQQHHTAWYKK